MLGFKQIELSDKDILDNFFIQTQNQISDTTFTNLYMWRRCYAVRWAVVEGHLVVQPNAWESSWVLPPYGHTYDDDDFKSAVEILADEFHDAGKEFVIRGITEREKDRMEHIRLTVLLLQKNGTLLIIFIMVMTYENSRAASTTKNEIT